MAHHLQPLSYFGPALWMPPWLLPPKPMELELPKPTPIYPLLDLRLEEQPLDLSLGSRQESVIQNAPEMAKGLFMPTCVAPNVKLREQSFEHDLPCENLFLSSGLVSPASVRSKKVDPIALDVVEYKTCKMFRITKSMLNGWLAKADKIHNSRPGSLKSGRSGRKPQFPKIEKELYVLYKQQMDKGAHKTNSTSSQKVTNKWIRDTAKQLARLQCSEQELQQGMCQFSERWLTNFKKRYGIQANGALKQGLENVAQAYAKDYSLSPSSSGPENKFSQQHLILP